MTESRSVWYSMVANASPAVERKVIIVSSLNLGDDLGTTFPLKRINSQPRTCFKWLSLCEGRQGGRLKSPEGVGSCPTRVPLRSLGRVHTTSPHAKWQTMAGKVTYWLPFSAASVWGQWPGVGVGLFLDGSPAGRSGGYLHDSPELCLLPQAAIFSSCVCHICVESCRTLPFLNSQERRFQVIKKYALWETSKRHLRALHLMGTS